MSKDLLLEIGTEEIPAHYMPDILAQLQKKAEKKFTDLRISFSKIKTYGTPRRIVLLVEALGERQADISTEAKGPSVKIAFDSDNKPTKAAIGFARGKKMAVEDLTVKDGYVYAVIHEEGKAVNELLQDVLPKLIEDLNFPKTMRWADLDFRFVRPIRWLVALFGNAVVPFTLAAVQSGAKTRGHRFLSDGEHVIKSADDYVKTLKDLFIIVDQNKRKEMITQQINELAAKHHGHAQITPNLLEEVTYLVEYPTALCGAFDEKYLQLPKEAVITPMREHQRYFPVTDDNGKLLPLFITIRNGGANALETVQHGNERVLRARLADAQFFFDEDRKKKLSDYLEKLKTVVFQEGLGTVYDKTLRLQELTGYLADVCKAAPADKKAALRAALLAKADLVTQMVCEFTELQGIMGREYALLDGEDDAVAKAIDEHYMPRFAGDALPETIPGQLVSLSDKIDTLTAMFSRKLIPTGSQDPFALRRQALGMVNTIIKAKLHISLKALLDKAMNLLKIDENKKKKLQAAIVDFLRMRLKTVLSEANVRYDIVDAVLTDIDDIYAVYLRSLALNQILHGRDMTAVIQSFVRVGNIAKKNILTIDESLFNCQEEIELYGAYQAVKTKVTNLKDDYQQQILALAILADPIDEFFTAVMVMDKDEKIKNNRLALMKNIDNLLRTVADFSKIVLDK